MAHKNFKVLDSDIHIIEPADSLAALHRPRVSGSAPSGVTEFPGDLRMAQTASRGGA